MFSVGNGGSCSVLVVRFMFGIVNGGACVLLVMEGVWFNLGNRVSCSIFIRGSRSLWVMGSHFQYW